MQIFQKESKPSYKAFLSAEYRIIASLADRILKNAKSLYDYKMKNDNSTPLAKRCNDFKLLESKCKEYLSSGKKQNLTQFPKPTGSQAHCGTTHCYVDGPLAHLLLIR